MHSWAKILGSASIEFNAFLKSYYSYQIVGLLYTVSPIEYLF